MAKINLLEDSNTEILKKTVKENRARIKPLEPQRGQHFSQFVDFVKQSHPELKESQAIRLFKAITSTWEATAPKMFIVDLLDQFTKFIEEKAKEAVDPDQTAIPTN